MKNTLTTLLLAAALALPATAFAQGPQEHSHETPRRMPNSITEAVLAKNKGGSGHPAGATAAPDTKG